MAETFAVIGLVSAVVAVTGMEAKLVCCLKKGKEPSGTFADVSDQLPLILETVDG